jgi:hypothetical protein
LTSRAGGRSRVAPPREEGNPGRDILLRDGWVVGCAVRRDKLVGLMVVDRVSPGQGSPRESGYIKELLGQGYAELRIREFRGGSGRHRF